MGMDLDMSEIMKNVEHMKMGQGSTEPGPEPTDINDPAPTPTSGGRKKSRKSRKVRKSRKSRKVRKVRKSKRSKRR
jgi:hypothetical protein